MFTLKIHIQKTCIVHNIVTQIWWAIGSMFGALLAYGVMGPDRLGWHWYLGLAAIPLALVLFFFPVCQLYYNFTCMY